MNLLDELREERKQQFRWGVAVLVMGVSIGGAALAAFWMGFWYLVLWLLTGRTNVGEGAFIFGLMCCAGSVGAAVFAYKRAAE